MENGVKGPKFGKKLGIGVKGANFGVNFGKIRPILNCGPERKGVETDLAKTRSNGKNWREMCRNLNARRIME